MQVLLRILGLQLLAELGARLPAAYARAVSVTLLVVANVVPVVGVWAGWMQLGDVFVVYWLENVIVGLCTVIRIATAEGPETSQQGRTSRGFLAVFFCFHYGIFTIVHGVFTLVMVGFSGGFESARSWLWAGLALLISHVVTLALYWFGQGERRFVAPSRAMFAPYPRMLVLHVAIIASFMLVVRSQVENHQAQPLLPVLMLIGLKLAVDVGLHLAERTRAARPAGTDTAVVPAG